MNHSSKISLVLLLIPMYNYCSSAEPKNNQGITFVRGTTVQRAFNLPLNTGTVAPQNNNDSTGTVAPQNSNSLIIDDHASNSSTSTNTTLAANSTSNNSVVEISNILGDVYKFPSIHEQTTDYTVGTDGIAKFTKLETSSTYVDRLLRHGKFASAAKYQKDSCLSDHIRRDLDAKKDALVLTSKNHSINTNDIMQKQRKENNQLFGAISALLEAVQKHTPGEITPGALELCKATVEESIIIHERLLTTFSAEITARKKFLEDTRGKLTAIKNAQQNESK